MNIGILGGTFNPIHFGHTFIANYVMDYMKFDKIMFIPSGIPPHKDYVIDKNHRKAMVELAIKSNYDFLINFYEMEKEDYSYSYETVSYLLKEYKNDKFYYIIGQEAFMLFDKWYKFEELSKLITFIVVTRGEKIKSELQKKFIKYDVDMCFLDTPNIEISSTDIRNRVKENRSIKYFVDEKVENYIIKNNLYKLENEKGVYI